MLEQSTSAPRHPRTRWARRLLAGLAIAGLTVTLASLPDRGADPVHLSAAKTCPTARPMQMVEANLRVGMTRAQAVADLKKVFLTDPDFVALNEVAGRPDALLTPAGYQIWRTPGQYTGANPVIWNTARWSPTAQGTIYISNQTGIPPGKKVHLGLRYANWVTLRSTDGCQTVSVVSYHVAPKGTDTTKLLIPSVHRLGGLVNQLAAEGPVLAAGDLNRHHGSNLYPRAELTSYGLTATWDMTGKRLPTGKQQGATIDYIFVRDAAQFAVSRQFTRDLNSDHLAVVAELVYNPGVPVARPAPTFVRGHVENVPTATTAAARRAVLSRVIKAIGLTPKGGTIQVATTRLGDPIVRNALRNAYRRGVTVQIVTTTKTLSPAEKTLVSLIGSSRSRPSWIIQKPHRPAAGLPATAIMINRTADVQLLGIQVNRQLDYRMASQPARGEFTLEKADFLNLRGGFSKQIR